MELKEIDREIKRIDRFIKKTNTFIKNTEEMLSPKIDVDKKPVLDQNTGTESKANRVI